MRFFDHVVVVPVLVFFSSLQCVSLRLTLPPSPSSSHTNTHTHTHTHTRTHTSHADVQVIGWNTQSSPPYWIIANSWGTSWGLDGFFYFGLGTGQCYLEANAIAGLYTPSA